MQTKPARGAVDGLANRRGRSIQHILLGLGLTAGAVAASALVAKMHAPTPEHHEAYSDYEEQVQPTKAPSRLFALVWPPLFMSLALSGLRVWNAPRSVERTQALTLWGTAQGLNAIWMALGPKRLGGQLAAAVASLGTAAAYVWRAKRVETPAAGMIAPYVGWMGFANVLTEELRRTTPQARATVH